MDVATSSNIISELFPTSQQTESQSSVEQYPNMEIYSGFNLPPSMRHKDFSLIMCYHSKNKRLFNYTRFLRHNRIVKRTTMKNPSCTIITNGPTWGLLRTHTTRAYLNYVEKKKSETCNLLPCCTTL